MRQRRVLVTGGSGQLGSAFQRIKSESWNIVPVSSAEMDIRHWPNVRDVVASVRPDLIIHAAAATNVDRCEREPEWAYLVNGAGTRHVAQAAARVGADLVYVSTNYVFNGRSEAPYHEFNVADPISIYGASKLAGEHEAKAATNRVYITRTASVFYETGTNFVATMRRLMHDLDTLTVVDDQFSNPTYALDLAAAIVDLVEVAPFGTYHVTNSGSTSWHGWATAIRDLTESTCAIEPIPASEYKRDAQPPMNGVMDSLLLQELGISLPDWHDALKRCIDSWPE